MEARYISSDEEDMNEENQEYDDNLEANIDNEDEEPRQTLAVSFFPFLLFKKN